MLGSLNKNDKLKKNTQISVDQKCLSTIIIFIFDSFID